MIYTESIFEKKDVELYRIYELEKTNLVSAFYTSNHISAWKYGNSPWKSSYELLSKQLGVTMTDMCTTYQTHTDNIRVMKKENGGEGIVFIKPWENHDIIKKIKLAEEAGAYAVGVDIDACGLVTLSMHGKKVVPKDVEALKELKASTKLPFIVKGIMTVEDAMLAVEAGVDAIVVSNHGGRVLDCTPGAADVLPAIAEAVKGKVTIYPVVSFLNLLSVSFNQYIILSD